MNNNDWLDIDVLEDYLDGKLDAKAMHRIERLSLEDPFVAEALAGLSLSPKRSQTLSLLQKQLQERVEQKPVEQKRWQLTTQRLSIAASAAVLFVTVSLLFWMRESNNRETIAATSPKKVEVAIAEDSSTEKSAPSNKPEADRVIIDAKTTVYANQSKTKVKKSTPASIAALMSSPRALPESENADISVDAATSVAQKKVAMAASALSFTASSNQNALLKGIVYGEDSLPIVGASVKLRNAKESTVTNMNGEFYLKLDSMLKNQKLNITSVGYLPKEVSFNTNQNLSIRLKPSNTALNEIVVAPSPKQVQSKRVMEESFIPQRAEPEGGINKFEEYVLNNNKLLIDKKQTGRSVSLTFEFDKEGTPFNIKVNKNFNMIPAQTKEEENEAIRLLKEGPKWLSPATAQMTIKSGYISIKF